MSAAQTTQPVQTTHVRCDNCGAGFTDYAGAIGGLGSLALAVVATVVAIRSRTDARRSADAADEALEMQRREHNAFMEERERAPRLQLSLAYTELQHEEDLYVVRLDVGVTNVGNRVADAAFVSVSVPEEARLELCDLAGESLGGSSDIMLDTAPLEPQGERQPVRRFGKKPFDIPATLQYVEYLRMVLPGPGRYPVHAMAAHPLTDDANAYAVVVIDD